MTRHRQPLLKCLYGCLALLVGGLAWFPTEAFATDTPLKGNLLAGQAVRAECPIGSYLVGLTGRTGAWIDRIAPVCEPLSADKQRLGKFTIGPMIGTSTGGKPNHTQCQNNEIVRVTTLSMTVDDTGRVKYVGSVLAECFTMTGAFVLGQRALYFGTPTDRPIPDLTSKPLDDRLECPPGEFARGFHVRAGEFIHAFGLICGPLAPLKPGTVPPAQAKNMPAALPTAPTINLPQGFVVKGKGVFKITPSQYLTGSHTQIQLKWLNPPVNLQGKGQAFYNYEAPMSLIGGPNGIAAPDLYLAPGTWEIRVRINQPKVSDWSQPVRFEYYLQNPAAAPKQEMPFGVEGQKKGGTKGTGTSAFRPQASPSQGIGVGTAVMRRGVEEQSGEKGVGTVAPSVETEKTP